SVVPFTPVNHDWVAQAGALEARHDGRRLTLSPLDTDPDSAVVRADALALITTRIAVGTTELALGTQPLVRGNGELAIASADVTETLVAHYGDLEQSWDFAARPAAPGDLEIRIAVSGETFAASTADSLHFSGG